MLGLGIRLAYDYIRTELQTASIRRDLVTVPAGTAIVRSGELIDRFFIVKRGEVALYCDREASRDTAVSQSPFTVVFHTVQRYRTRTRTPPPAVIRHRGASLCQGQFALHSAVHSIV